MEPNSRIDALVSGQLSMLFRGQITLREFQHWFAPHAWYAASAGNRESHIVTRRIELKLAEYTNGHVPEDEILWALSEVASSARMERGLTVGTQWLITGGNSLVSWTSPSSVPTGMVEWSHPRYHSAAVNQPEAV